MKKKIALITILLLPLMLFIGCNNGTQNSSSSGNNGSEVVNPTTSEGLVDVVVPTIVDETPRNTPLNVTYNFEEVDPRDHGKAIVLSSLEDFKNFRDRVNAKDDTYVNGYIELDSDIVLVGEWEPIEGFKGQFNGKNHKISGLSINSTKTKKGLFSNIIDAKLGCFTVTGDLNLRDSSAAVVGYTSGNCSIVGIQVNGIIKASNNAGGIVGTIASGSLKVTGCINNATITGQSYLGGIVGANKSHKINIYDSANYGFVSGNSTVGGIIGSVTHSTSVANDYSVNTSFNYGTVLGTTYTGGITGLSCSQLISCGVGVKGKTYEKKADGNAIAKTLVSFETPYVSSLCGSLLYNPSINECGELIECQNEDGFAITGINNPAGCTRVINFKDKIYLFAATNKYAVSTDGGHTFGSFTIISDKTTEICPIDGEASTDTGNTQPWVLPDGRIAMFYRAIRKASSFSYGSLRLRISDENGVFDASDKPITLIENYTKLTSLPGAFYEPYPILLDDGTIAIYISEDVHGTEKFEGANGYKCEPLDSDLVCPGGSQNTVMIPIKVPSGAKEVGKASEGKIEIGEPKLIFRGSDTSMFGHSNSRPGMTILTKLYDGSWAMTLENSTEQKDPGYNLVTQITYSKDGLNWTPPQTIIRPHQEGGKMNGDATLYKCCAPFCTTLPDGRLFITCATDEIYEGLFPKDDSHYKHEIAFVTKNRIGYGDVFYRDEDMIQVGNYSYSKNEYCVWASCEYIKENETIYVSGLQGVNYQKTDGTVGSPTNWILLQSINYKELYQRLGLEEIK